MPRRPRTRSSPAWSGSPRRTPAASPRTEEALSYVVNLKLADPTDAPAFVDDRFPTSWTAPALQSWQDIRDATRPSGQGHGGESCGQAAGCSDCSPWPASRSSSAAGWPTRPDASDCSKRSAAHRASSLSCCSPSTWPWPCSRRRSGWRPDGWPPPCSPIPAPASSAAQARPRSPCPRSAWSRPWHSGSRQSRPSFPPSAPPAPAPSTRWPTRPAHPGARPG